MELVNKFQIKQYSLNEIHFEFMICFIDNFLKKCIQSAKLDCCNYWLKWTKKLLNLKSFLYYIIINIQIKIKFRIK